jgi:hypothetical protein
VILRLETEARSSWLPPSGRSTVISLRAHPGLDAVVAGMLMASASGKSVYRVLEVVRVRVHLGVRERCHFRLILGRLRQAEVPPGVEVHPWCLRAPRPPPRAALVVAEPMRSRTVVAAEIGQRRNTEHAAQLARIGRIGREKHTGVDLGPEVRRRAMRDRSGQLLREADCEVEERAADPDDPNRKLRRAFRSDPLLALERAGSITKREARAAEDVRNWLEQATTRLGGMSTEAVHRSPYDQQISSEQLVASSKLRRLAAKLGKLWPPVLWVCMGGTVTSFASFQHMRLEVAGELVRISMKALADHLYGPARSAA